MKLRYWLFLLLPALASAQVSTIRSVSSLPATCNPGGGAGGAPQDIVSLFSGGNSVQYNCTSTNTWTANTANPPFSSLSSGTNTSATMHVGTGASLDTSGSGTIAATSTPFSGLTGSTNTTATMVVGAGSNLSPTNPRQTSQIAGSQAWLQPGLVAPSATASNTGGSLNSGHATFIVYTLNSALGETLPSAEISANNIGGFGGGCTTGTACSITVTAPTLPTGYTGYTVYSRDCNTLSTCAGPELRQAASNACVNITGNCVIQIGGAGAALPTLNTAVVAPPNNTTGFVPSYAAIPSLFFPKADNNYYPLAGMDFSAGGSLPSPDGTFEFWHRVFVNDSGLNIASATQQGGGCIKNTLFSICHLSGQTTSTGSSTDDRAFSVRSTDSPTSPTYEQWLGYYGEHFVYNNNFACNPIGTGMVQEDCVAAIRVRANDQRTAGVNNITSLVGIHSTASTNVASPKFGSCLPCVVGVVGTASQETVSTQNGSGAFYVGVLGSTFGSSGNTNGSSAAFWAKAPINARFSGSNIGMYIENFSNAADFGIRSDATTKSYFRGAIDLDSFNPLNSGTLNSGGSLSPLGLGTRQLSSVGSGVSSVSPVGTPGSTTYTYKLVFKDVNGSSAAAGTSFNIVSGNATLNGSNFNRIQLWTSANSQVLNCPSTVDIYRTTSGGTPSNTGKIGTFTVTDCTAFFTSQTFDDTGLAGDNSTPPTTNSTGSVQAASFNRGTLNTVQKTASDFTTSSATLVTLFTWNLPTVAANYSFDCKLVYSQQTAGAGLLLGIESANVSPTSLMVSARIFSTNIGTSTDATSTITNTTATTVLTGAAPGAINTNYQADMYGTIEAPAAGPGIALNVKVATANVLDQITILRGSYCQLY